MGAQLAEITGLSKIQIKTVHGHVACCNYHEYPRLSWRKWVRSMNDSSQAAQVSCATQSETRPEIGPKKALRGQQPPQNNPHYFWGTLRMACCLRTCLLMSCE